MPTSPARLLALRAFGRARRTGCWIRDALRDCARNRAISREDRAFAWRLAMGATLARGSVEARVVELVRRPSSLEPRVRDALILGAYELGYFSTPLGIAVDQWVDAVGGVASRARGLANAVLRNLVPLRTEVEGARGRVAAGGYGADDLQRATGLPAWLSERLRNEMGAQDAALLALGLMEAAPTWLVATSPCAREDALDRAGLDPRPEGIPGIWRLDAPSKLEESDALSKGFSVEDRSAYEIALASVPKAGGSRLEVGVGRGTKALVCATALSRLGIHPRLTCVDASAHRLEEARGRFRREGVDATFITGDGRDLDALVGRERYDLVFIDAPCSGTGTMRRHPEIAWNLDPSSIDASKSDSLPALQLELLEAAARHVGPRGHLLYATCSALREENEEVVGAFLEGAAGADFERVAPKDLPGISSLDELARGQLAQDGWSDRIFKTTPRLDGPDLHFLAAFRRKDA